MKKKKIFLFIIACAAIVAVFWIWQKHYQVKKMVSSSSDYKDISLDKIRLTGVEGYFSVRNGEVYKDNLKQDENGQRARRVLKLANFYQTVKESPILFDSNLDTVKFSKALNKMREVNDYFSESTGYGYVQPVSFLEGFLKTSVSYGKMSSEISEENAQALLDDMEKTQADYESEAGRFHEFFRDAVDSGYDKSKVAFLGGETKSDVKIMEQDLSKIQKNALILKERINQLKKCYEKNDCNRYILENSKPSLISKEYNNLPETTSSQYVDYADIELEGGPYLVESSCWSKRDQSILFEGKKCSKQNNEQCLDWPVLGGGEYWVRNGEQEEYERKMKERGAEFRYQSSSAPYGCMNLTYRTKLRTMDFFFKKYGQDRFFKKSDFSKDRTLEEVDDIWTEGIVLEGEFFDSKYPSSQKMDNLREYYIYTYSLLVKKNIYPKEREDLLERINILNGESVGLDMIMDRISYHFGNHMEYGIEKIKETENKNFFFVFNILVTRLDYSINFLNFSKFIWLSGELPQYMDNDNGDLNDDVDLKNRGIMSDRQAIEIYRKEDILKWNLISREYNFQF